ncbi:UDP-glycosyltransferase UGT5-like [Drosophila tropicalis]|uniref:UDP-glycosyltransferase UGT5-like n=1 Tax=Drosophila tropicalis TaxID=46794 RepID=UPI0035ABC8BE
MLIGGNLRQILILLVTLPSLLRITRADNILAVFSFGVESPYILVRPLVQALVQRGHQLTVISAEKYLSPINGTKHIRVKKLNNLLEEMTEFTFERTPNKWMEANWLSRYFVRASHHILTNPDVQQLLVNSSAHFDMIIMDAPHSGALCGFAEHFKAPMVGLAAFGSNWIVDYFAGNSAPTIYDPVSPVGYLYGSSSIFDKWKKWIYMTEEWLLDRLVFVPPHTKQFKQHFSNLNSNFEKSRRNFSLILVNHHFSLGRVKSNVPNLIDVAGMHICFEKECKLDPIPEDLQRFMDEAEHGVIYFSMGLEIQMKLIPDCTKQMLFNMFFSLKQRVVWKYDNWESFNNKSDNIFFASYLPQEQILRHPKVKLFITHAGLLSVIETAYYGVPTLSLPLYYDQFINAHRMHSIGLSKTIDFISINSEILNQSIQQILYNPSYAINAKKLSTRFRDQPMNPLQTAIWWTEYVLRHKGAPHMRITEHDLSFMKYYKIDLISIVLLRIGISAIIIIFLGFKLINWIINQTDFSLNSLSLR